ncbi:MAG: 50S ribosomal protein L21 [Candidatus Omnitrophota bacterium]
MYAIVQLGSKQYRVSEGDVIPVDHFKEEPGKSVTLDQVLLVGGDKDVKVGQPAVKGASVQAEVVNDVMGEKLVVFKYRRRKDSALKKGHRSRMTALKIKKINT